MSNVFVMNFSWRVRHPTWIFLFTCLIAATTSSTLPTSAADAYSPRIPQDVHKRRTWLETIDYSIDLVEDLKHVIAQKVDDMRNQRQLEDSTWKRMSPTKRNSMANTMNNVIGNMVGTVTPWVNFMNGAVTVLKAMRYLLIFFTGGANLQGGSFDQ